MLPRNREAQKISLLGYLKEIIRQGGAKIHILIGVFHNFFLK